MPIFTYMFIYCSKFCSDYWKCVFNVVLGAERSFGLYGCNES